MEKEKTTEGREIEIRRGKETKKERQTDRHRYLKIAIQKVKGTITKS
jgi:hypothetical protein